MFASGADQETVRLHLNEAVSRGRTRSPVKVRKADGRPTVTTPEGLVVEELEYYSENTEQGWVPLRILQPEAVLGQPRPVVVFLHATGKDMGQVLSMQLEYAAAGYLTAAIDCRYHGLRSNMDAGAYSAALIAAWRGSGEHPFLLDNVWDLVLLLDYLEQRPDVDAARIGMTGISLGGMHTWLCASLDTRVAVAAPMIGVQGFKWAVDNECFQGRVDSIPSLFAAAADDMQAGSVTADVVRAVWAKVMPGLLEHYDAPFSLPCIAPRPLLIANGEVDPRCPLHGLKEPMQLAQDAYLAAGLSKEETDQRLVLHVEPGLGHATNPSMFATVRAWFDKFLLVPATAT